MSGLPEPMVPAEVDLRDVARLLETVFRTARVAPKERLHRPPAVAIYSGGQGEDMATKRKAISKIYGL